MISSPSEIRKFGFEDFPGASEENLPDGFVRAGVWTCKLHTATSDQFMLEYIPKGTFFTPIDIRGLTHIESYASSFPSSHVLRNGDMLIASRKGSKDSLVTLRVYECVVIAAMLGKGRDQFLGMYHYNKGQDPRFFGVTEFINHISQKIVQHKIQQADIHIELATGRLTSDLAELARRILLANLPISRILSQRVLAHDTELKVVVDSNVTTEDLKYLLTESIGVKITFDGTVDLFRDNH